MSIILKNVSKKMKNNIILQDINLELKPNKIYGFVGRNGSGKTMLFKVICGFIKPDSGHVVVNNKDINKGNIFPENTRALIEKPKFLTNLTGFENLKLLATIQNKIAVDDIEESLRKVNLYNEKDKKYGNYSLGMKQKLGIAQVIMENPDIMILDEPFSGLENESVEKIQKLLLDEKEKGKIILIATHIKQDIDVLCDQVFMMDAGKIIDIKVKEDSKNSVKI